MLSQRTIERPTARPRTAPFVHGGLALQLRELLRSAITLHRADFGNIQLFDPVSESLTIVASQGFDAQFLHYFRVVGDTNTACGRALTAGVTRAINDVEHDPEFASHRAAAARAGFRSVRSEPLIGESGQRLGVLSTHFRRTDGPSHVDPSAAASCARLATTLIENHLQANVKSAPDDPSAAAAERLQAVFDVAAKVERARMDRAYAENPRGTNGLVAKLRRPIPLPELADATTAYVRALRALGASAESVVMQVKRTLGASAGDRARDCELISAVISVAILAYYAEPASRGER